jgi:cob(I)alamin adenosyltransferase
MRDDIRVPLHELQADVDYLFGRVAADGACAPAMAASVKEKLAKVEAGIEQLEAALREIDEAVLAEREACAAIAAKRPHHSGIEIAELIHDQSSPPKAST